MLKLFIITLESGAEVAVSCRRRDQPLPNIAEDLLQSPPYPPATSEINQQGNPEGPNFFLY